MNVLSLNGLVFIIEERILRLSKLLFTRNKFPNCEKFSILKFLEMSLQTLDIDFSYFTIGTLLAVWNLLYGL